MILTSK